MSSFVHTEDRVMYQFIQLPGTKSQLSCLHSHYIYVAIICIYHVLVRGLAGFEIPVGIVIYIFEGVQ